jgi:hypothetical protein
MRRKMAMLPTPAQAAQLLARNRLTPPGNRHKRGKSYSALPFL